MASLDPALIGVATAGDPLYPGLGNLGYDVQAYDVRIRTDPATNDTSIQVGIDAVATHRLGRFSLDYSGTGVSAVGVDEAAAPYVLANGKIEITPRTVIADGASFGISVDIGGRPRPLRSAGWTWVAGEQVSAYGLYDALPSWLPVNADPADKATVDTRVVVPRPFVAVAQGARVAVTDLPGGQREFHWRAGPTSGFTLTIREYATVDLGTVAGIPLRSYQPADLRPRQAEAINVVRQLLEVLVDRYGPYPFDELNLVWVDGRSDQRGPDEGLLHWGPQLRDGQALAHHLSHLWFQVNVTPRTAHESYLRAAFANYADLLWLEVSDGVAARDRLMSYWYDQLDGRTEAPADPSEAAANEALFSRGPLSLHALRRLVGDKQYFEILRTWVTRFHRGSATVGEFVALAEEVSGRSLDAWETGWLRSEVVPPATELGLPAA